VGPIDFQYVSNRYRSASARMSLSSEDPPRNANDSYAIELQFSVLELLGNRVQKLSILIEEEGIILNGDCDSFHTKQMAQEIVTKNTSRRVVANLMIVRELLS
jgi:hypothetical protein